MTSRMRRTRRMIPVGALLTLGLFAAADLAWSQPPDGDGPRRGRMMRRGAGGPGGPGGLPLGRLDLSEAQREQVRLVMEQNQEATGAAMERVRTVREALTDAVTAEVVNEGAIRAVATELGAAEGDAAVQRAYVHSQLWQHLTPEQQAAAQEMQAQMEQRRERMGERRARRRRDPA